LLNNPSCHDVAGERQIAAGSGGDAVHRPDEGFFDGTDGKNQRIIGTPQTFRCRFARIRGGLTGFDALTGFEVRS
jgi:hypothetical protein